MGGGEWSPYLRERALGSSDWSLGGSKRRSGGIDKSFGATGNRTQAVQCVSCRYTDWTFPTHDLRTSRLSSWSMCFTWCRYLLQRVFRAPGWLGETHTSLKEHNRSFCHTRWRNTDWPTDQMITEWMTFSLPRDVTVSADKMFWTSNKPAQWTLHNMVFDVTTE
jgi:hypothetical protein